MAEGDRRRPTLALAAPGPGTAGAEDRTKYLTRSIYVPVVFSIAPELGEVRLAIAGEEETFPPEPRVFLFTYYPEHRRILPEMVEVRFRATGGCAGEPFESRFFVTATAIHGGSSALDFEEEGLRRLRKGRRREREDRAQARPYRVPRRGAAKGRSHGEPPVARQFARAARRGYRRVGCKKPRSARRARVEGSPDGVATGHSRAPAAGPELPGCGWRSGRSCPSPLEKFRRRDG